MLSFEISAIDVVLMVVMLVLFLLFIAQRRSQPMAEPQLNIDDQEKHTLEETKAAEENMTEDSLKKHSAEGFQKCVHEFGYLRDMPKNTPIPDECFGCPKVLRCMFPSA